MCQLTLTNLGSAERNVGAVYFASYLNADHNAPHGMGFYNGKEIWKTVLRGSCITDLGSILRENIITDDPIISHVRLASKGIELKEENNHPFETKDFIGAHNGTLYLKGEDAYSYNTVDTNSSRGSDSKRFFEMLQEEYTSNGNKFIAAIKTTMEKHKGKFAFLIYEKPTKNYWIVRGKSADLHLSEVYNKKKYIGFIVNTEKDDLYRTLMETINYWGLIGLGGDFTFTEPVELEKETIFLLKKNKIYKMDSILESPLYERPATPVSSTPFNRFDHKDKTINSLVGIDASINIIREFMIRHMLSPQDIDLIFVQTLGISVIEAETEDITTFIRKVMPKISANNATRKLFNKKHIDIVRSEFYTTYGLEFPWMCNPRKELEKAVNAWHSNKNKKEPVM